MTKASIYIPYVFRSFQGFSVQDIKEFQTERQMEIILVKIPDKKHYCSRCGHELGAQDGRYWVKAKHLRVMSWQVVISFWREKRHCPNCKKIRSEQVDFLCPTSPHMTVELAWWINRLSEITSVLAVSRLESVDKMACYCVDKYILTRMLQGYKIPKVTHISVDEVYARGKKQLKEGENRDDLFLTVIVDIKTHRVIWVSQSRRKQALDEFFQLLGSDACKDIEVVATDQHEAYATSVHEHCPNATVVWDRFHLVQKFNEALNEDRREELERIDPEGGMGDLMNGKYRYIFLTKAERRSERDKAHINEVMRLNERMTKMELIKERFFQFFEAPNVEEARTVLNQIWAWSLDSQCRNILKWVTGIMETKTLWNYFTYRVTTGLSEGINRVIKGVKWQAYGYKDMFYFKLKILQKCGYLNHRYYSVTV